jgi:hypothetical protein
VSLAFLQDHRKIATVGAHCNGCGHKHRWPIEESHRPEPAMDHGRRVGAAVAVLQMRLANRGAIRNRAVTLFSLQSTEWHMLRLPLKSSCRASLLL